MAIRPIDIARKLGISTTTLRKYEAWELVPPVSRTASGYRVYTEEHVAYFACIRAMLPGFTLKQIAAILKEVMAQQTDTARWMATKAQADLYREKKIAEQIVKTLLHKSEFVENTGSRLLTIHEVSQETGVPATTIRYWD